MSKVELPITGISISSISDVTKLPSVATGRSSLVASPSLPKAHCYTHKEIAGNWALELRTRINESIECHEDVNEDDIMTLKKELIAIFITTLQADSRKEWSVFVEILALLEPYKEFFDYFETKAEFHHYLERVLYHVEFHKEKLFDLHIETNLIRVFPEHVRQLKAKGLAPAKNYCIVPPLTQGLGTPSRMIAMRQQDTVPSKSHLNPRNLLPDGTNPYSSYIPTDKEIVGAKSLTIRDISKSMGAVALEMAARESIWNHTLGTTALALATDLPEEDEPSSVRKSLHVLQLSSRKEKTPRPVPNMQEEVLVMNGREAVQYFTSCYHMGQIKSLYLNLATNKHYRPYDLISVPKSKANPEHYVFSTFGVLHVYPDQASESLTLAEWQREAVLWNAISNIPFFKNYLIRKAFHRWKTNHQFTEFQRRQRQVLSNLLSAMPPFGAALLQISHLLKELLTVPFLPSEIDKTYELGEFENSINYKNIQADQLLGRFFKYCKMVVDFTSDEAFKKLRHCEEQLKKKTYFSKDSLSLQRMKKEEREKNLANAKQETSLLGNFVKLVDQLIVEHMFEITKTQTIFFVNKVLSVGLDAPREGFFKANLVFDKEGKCFK
ncbi:unnamed protein product [Lymnaea stagnalis]|uniref:Uncharacterized protein n=1 Tax=Lymnaea stagnalis TaxID=6523 RepID=A0AAV2I8C3_LYMST